MASQIEIRKIPFEKKPVKEFILLAWEIYKSDPHWVPPLIFDQMKLLNPKQNPFFQHSETELFGAYENGKMVGRIAVGVNHHSNQYWNEKVAFFGFFEAMNQREIAEALFHKAAQYCREKNMQILRGPFSLTYYNEAGLLVDGFDRDPYIMMTYNPSYYPTFFEQCGFSKAIDAYAYYMKDWTKCLDDPLLQLVNYTKETLRPTIRPIDKGKNFLRDVYTVMDMVNESLARNWGFFPLTKNEVEFIAKDLKIAVVPDLCFFIEVNGKTAGVAITFPNYNEAIKKANGRLFPFGLLKILYYSRKVKAARCWQLGLIKEYQKTGLGAYCYAEITKRAAQRGIHEGEISIIFENNKAMVNGAQLLGSKRYKTYRFYEKRIA